MSEPTLLVVLILLMLVGTGLFSGSEIALISARRSRIDALAAEGSRSGARMKRLQDNMDGFLATVQIGVTLFGTLAGVIMGGWLASRYLEPLFGDWAFTRFVAPAVGASVLVGGGIVYG